MTKGELIRMLEPFDDEIEVYATAYGVGPLPILSGRYMPMEGDHCAKYALILPPLEVQINAPGIRIKRKQGV